MNNVYNITILKNGNEFRKTQVDAHKLGRFLGNFVDNDLIRITVNNECFVWVDGDDQFVCEVQCLKDVDAGCIELEL